MFGLLDIDPLVKQDFILYILILEKHVLLLRTHLIILRNYLLILINHLLIFKKIIISIEQSFFNLKNANKVHSGVP